MSTWDVTLGASVKQSSVNFNSSGDNTVIAGVVGQSIKVLQFFFQVTSSVAMSYKSGATVISGPMNFPGGMHEHLFVHLPLTCNSGDSFIVNVNSAVQVGGTIWFTQG